MKTALLASIAFSLFWMNFLNTTTRVDDLYTALGDFYPDSSGDLVLASGVPIVAAVVAGIVKVFKR